MGGYGIRTASTRGTCETGVGHGPGDEDGQETRTLRPMALRPVPRRSGLHLYPTTAGGAAIVGHDAEPQRDDDGLSMIPVSGESVMPIGRACLHGVPRTTRGTSGE